MKNKTTPKKESPIHWADREGEGRIGYQDIGYRRLLSKVKSLTNIMGSFFRNQVSLFLPRYVAPFLDKSSQRTVFPGRLHRCFSLHKAPAESSLALYLPQIQISEHKEKKIPPPPHHRYNQKIPQSTRRMPEVDPTSTKPGKRADWTFPPPRLTKHPRLHCSWPRGFLIRDRYGTLTTEPFRKTAPFFELFS